MNVVCLDMEGVLVPEIWIAFANAVGVPELKRTTRDEPNYDKLMQYRLEILKQHNLGLKEIQDVIATIDVMDGAKEFLDELRSVTQVIILSDTFEQFAAGDSFNDLGMIEASKAGFLFKSTEQIKKDYPHIPAYEEYDELLAAIKAAL